MTKKKVTIILEGNDVSVEQAIHELSKFRSQADKQPKLDASMQSEVIEGDENLPGFGDTDD